VAITQQLGAAALTLARQLQAFDYPGAAATLDQALAPPADTGTVH
jgi:hypothetical protein